MTKRKPQDTITITIRCFFNLFLFFISFLPFFKRREGITALLTFKEIEKQKWRKIGKNSIQWVEQRTTLEVRASESIELRRENDRKEERERKQRNEGIMRKKRGLLGEKGKNYNGGRGRYHLFFPFPTETDDWGKNEWQWWERQTI